VTSTSTAPLTLHVVETAEEVRRLGDRMHNCLGGYARMLRGAHRIVEVRRGGRTVYAVHVERGRIVTFEAPGNRRPDPADVPEVRRLLEASGVLAVTATAERRSAPRPTLPPLPAPERPTPPPPPPGISVQQLAAEFLGPASLQGPDWTEVAAALWAVGLLPRLPGPEHPSFARVVRDLASRVATGDDAGLPRGAAPSATSRQATRRALLDRATPDEPQAWRLRRMAAVLEVPLRA
jgi:hypothetical protein